MGGGGVSIPQRNPSAEFNQIFKNAWPQQRKAYRGFFDTEPLLSGARDYALGNLDKIGTLTDPLFKTFQALQPILESQGALTPEQTHAQDQQIYSNLASQGMATTSPATFEAALNRDQYRRQRFNEALTQAMGTAGGIQGLQSGMVSQLLGPEAAAVGAYSTLMNPILSYMSDLNSSNQNAAAAQSVAGGNKSSGLIGGATSLLGSVASAY